MISIKQKNTFVILFVFLVVLTLKDQEFFTDTQQHYAPSGFNAVLRVIDGDTISVEMDGMAKTVRLIGLNTPETVDRRRSVECFGKQASDKAKEILDEQYVRLEKDLSQGDVDKYGRLLRYIFLEDGSNFNLVMIKQGYGHEYTYDLPYEYQAEFKEAESIAKTEGRGLWAKGVCE